MENILPGNAFEIISGFNNNIAIKSEKGNVLIPYNYFLRVNNVPRRKMDYNDSNTYTATDSIVVWAKQYIPNAVAYNASRVTFLPLHLLQEMYPENEWLASLSNEKDDEVRKFREFNRASPPRKGRPRKNVPQAEEPAAAELVRAPAHADIQSLVSAELIRLFTGGGQASDDQKKIWKQEFYAEHALAWKDEYVQAHDAVWKQEFVETNAPGWKQEVVAEFAQVVKGLFEK